MFKAWQDHGALRGPQDSIGLYRGALTFLHPKSGFTSTLFTRLCLLLVVLGERSLFPGF